MSQSQSVQNSTVDKAKYLGHLTFLEKIFEGLQARLAASAKEGSGSKVEAIDACLAVIRREIKSMDTIPVADWQERCRRMEERLADCFG